MTQTVVVTPRIPTGARSVFKNGRDPAPFLLALCLVPAIAFAIAFADQAIGFQVFMAGAGTTMLVLILALYLRSRALRAGTIRMDAEGGLRFAPPAYLRVTMVVVALAFMIPAVVSLLITALDLPTQQGSTRFTTVFPYALGVFSLGLLAQLLWSLRTPAGLCVSLDGLRGVRGSKSFELGWDELVAAKVVGEHGPKLALFANVQGAVIVIDAHLIGSDPAIVAAVIEYYRTSPTRRAGLSDGAAAINAVELGSH